MLASALMPPPEREYVDVSVVRNPAFANLRMNLLTRRARG